MKNARKARGAPWSAPGAGAGAAVRSARLARLPADPLLCQLNAALRWGPGRRSSAHRAPSRPAVAQARRACQRVIQASCKCSFLPCTAPGRRSQCTRQPPLHTATLPCAFTSSQLACTFRCLARPSSMNECSSSPLASHERSGVILHCQGGRAAACAHAYEGCRPKRMCASISHSLEGHLCVGCPVRACGRGRGG